jgi:hypothetical protein
MTDQPDEVCELALRLGADPSGVTGHSVFQQLGEMKLSLASARWHSFTARQTMAVTSCAFHWHARFRPFGYLSVTDALQAGKGQLDVTALGVIPLARRRPCVALTKGEMMRYLAELPYAPDAMLHNRALGWRVIRPDQLAVRCGPAAMQIEVVFALDVEGRVASATVQDRPRSASPPYQPTPWRAEFSDYRHQLGRWVPFEAKVAWIIDGQQVPYWRGHLSRWSMATPPYAAMVAGAPSPLLQGNSI